MEEPAGREEGHRRVVSVVGCVGAEGCFCSGGSEAFCAQQSKDSSFLQSWNHCYMMTGVCQRERRRALQVSGMCAS